MNNKIKILVILSLVVATILSGCITGPKKIETPEGKATIGEVPGGKGPGWCQAGIEIKQETAGQKSSYIVKGITTYEGKSVCEAEMKVSGVPGGEGVWKYYFTENGEYAVIIMKDPTGKEQKIVVSNPNP